MQLTKITDRYETEVDKLPQTHFELGGGAAVETIAQFGLQIISTISQNLS